MKQNLFFAVLILLNSSFTLYCASNPQPSQPATQHVQDDDEDGKVVLANVANILQGMGILSTDPYNPAVAGPAIAQIGISVVNVIIQAFKSMHIRGEITREQVEAYFQNFPDEIKMKLYAMLVAYADAMGAPITEPHAL